VNPVVLRIRSQEPVEPVLIITGRILANTLSRAGLLPWVRLASGVPLRLMATVWAASGRGMIVRVVRARFDAIVPHLVFPNAEWPIKSNAACVAG